MKQMRYRPSAAFLVTTAVVLVVGLGMLIPATRPARSVTSQISCNSQLRMIFDAKWQWARQVGATNGAEVDFEAVSRLIQMRLACPQGGHYTFGLVGAPPSCSCGRTYPR